MVYSPRKKRRRRRRKKRESWVARGKVPVVRVPPKKFLTPREISRLCGVHYNTVLEWCKKGHLPFIRLMGGQYVIRTRDFVDFARGKLLVRVEFEGAGEGAGEGEV